MASKLLGVLLLVAISSSAQGFVSYDEFRKLTSAANRTQYNNFNKYAYTIGKISSKEEAAMALAQILHESAHLSARREWGCGDSSCSDLYRSECDVPGKSYYGRGYLQLRWCYNYQDASTAIFGDSKILLNDPDKVAKDDNLAWLTALWFWGARIHSNPGVERGQFGATTKALAPQECAAGNAHRRQREIIYAEVRRALGLSRAGNLSGCY